MSFWKNPKSLGSTSTMLVSSRLIGAAITVLSQLVLARTMPAESLGLFFLTTSTVAVLAMMSTVGFPNISNRILSRYRVSSRSGQAATFVKLGCFIAGVASIIIMISAAIAAALFAASETAMTLAVGMVALPAVASSYFLGSILNAERKFLWASLPELLLRPSLLLFYIAVLILFDLEPTALILVIIFAMSCIAIVLLHLWKVKRVYPNLFSAKRAASRLGWRWVKMSSPLVVVSLFTNLFADIAIVVSGMVLGQAALAPLAIAVKLSLLVGFSVQIIHQQILPDLADAIRMQDMKGYNVRISQTNHWTVAITATATVIAILFGEQILALFGDTYKEVSVGLALLVASQVVRAMSGPASHILVITGRSMIVQIVTLGMLLFLCISIPISAIAYGSLGAISAICLAIMLWNGILAASLSYITGMSSHFRLSDKMRHGTVYGS